ncbi:DNA-binding MurR/RpiR family transcriptional regulator [Rhizobium sp. BK619]|uniref:MurR/RpiR family transcriptional regulator n=1 Tax=Rhizobium sp. BK619 TaxID=2586989 RepID=UPI0017D98F2E|nr:MurR/RpiR family transcriptional regulator [Rhizobium sp. BK619]MBB3649639.1 DNA-binding MurR/RpiR family transcriptional regulator [Rhizobium sp. BK619]
MRRLVGASRLNKEPTPMSAQQTLQKPNSIAELKGMITAAGLRLPEQQERVARKMLARPDIVAFGTISSVAGECVVSPSTVVRVANALGFDTFRELKCCFQQHLRSISGAARPVISKPPASAAPH